MNPQTAYYKDGTELILDYLKNAYGKQFHAYWEGDPGDIPSTLLPCIVVSKVRGTSNPGPTGTQDVTEEILVQVIVNKKDDFGAAAAYPRIDMTNRKLRILAEGRDEATAAYLTTSVCGILSKNITLGENVLQLTMATDYMLARRGNDMLTSEAHITVSLRERIIIQMRQ
jgi:hypothetical protein